MRSVTGSALTGSYRLISLTVEAEGQPVQEIFGKRPNGLLAITAGYLFAIVTADGRRPGLATAAKVALYDSLISYAGPYEIEGDRLTTVVDTSWNQAWTGTRQLRFWKLNGKRLTLTTEPISDPRNPSGPKGRVVLVWEKIE